MSTPGVRHPGRVKAQVVGVATSLVGSALVAVAVVWMNTGGVNLGEGQSEAVAEFTVPTPPPPKPKQDKPRERKRRKRPSKAPPPAALLTAGLSGLEIDLAGFDADALEGTTEDLLGEGGEVVMTEETVDSPPRPVRQVAPTYPARARAKNIQGSVMLAVLVRDDGSVGDVRVLQSEPAGVFDQTAVAAVRQWAFEPATYQGQPVSLRMQIIIPFRLE